MKYIQPPAICGLKQGVDGRNKSGHDGLRCGLVRNIYKQAGWQPD
jgi:hypothetical protein